MNKYKQFFEEDSLSELTDTSIPQKKEQLDIGMKIESEHVETDVDNKVIKAIESIQIKRYDRFFEDTTINDEEENLLIRWFTGNLQKKGNSDSILPLFLKISKDFPILENKKLYRSIRIPLTGIEEKSTVKMFVSKPGVFLSSWTENFKTAMDIFNNSHFYDVLTGYASVIISCTISGTHILANYRTIKQVIEKNNLNKLKKIFNKWAKEKEYVVYNKDKFICKVEHVVR